MRVRQLRAAIWLRVVAVIAVGIAVAASGCTTGRPSEPPSSTGTSSTPPGGEEAIVARIRLPGSPFSVATGEGWVWALTRQPAAAVWRIDPKTNRVVGTPTRLPVDPWHIAVGAGSVWVTPNGADGRLLRIDPRTGQISARISARPIYFGSVLAFGAGFVWTGNDDERYQQGSTVSKLDPATNQVIGEPLALGSPQSIAFGHGGNRLLEADPDTARIRRLAPLPIGPIDPAVGAGSIWSGSAAVWGAQATRDDRVVRIDPRTLAVVDTFHLGDNVSAVAFGYGSLWAAGQTGQLVRITPAHSR